MVQCGWWVGGRLYHNTVLDHNDRSDHLQLFQLDSKHNVKADSMLCWQTGHHNPEDYLSIRCTTKMVVSGRSKGYLDQSGQIGKICFIPKACETNWSSSSICFFKSEQTDNFLTQNVFDVKQTSLSGIGLVSLAGHAAEQWL